MGFFDRLKNAVNPQEGDDYENDGYTTSVTKLLRRPRTRTE